MTTIYLCDKPEEKPETIVFDYAAEAYYPYCQIENKEDTIVITDSCGTKSEVDSAKLLHALL